MRTPDIPLRYRTDDPKNLGHDLGRLAVGLITFFRGLPSERDTVPEVGKLSPDGSILAFGQMARVSPREDQWITLKLPAPDSVPGGRSLSVVRLSTLGAVEVIATDCLVSGFPRLLLLSPIGITTITFDGTNYYLNPGGALNWGYGLL